MLIEYLKRLKNSYFRKHVLSIDIKKYSNVYSGSKNSIDSGATAARDILVYCHVVEKGLSHKIIKPLFGYDRVSKIASSLEEYIHKGGNDNYIINTAVSTLKEYNRINAELGISNDKLISIPKGLQNDNSINIGVDEFCPDKDFNFEPGIFSNFINCRHSIRLYDCKSLPIELDEIVQCIQVAQQCPSACNRQAVRVKIVLEPSIISEICDIQGGAKGFGQNSGAIIMVTSDISLYEPSERRIPMYDCGLFSMNLVYALLENKISTCILNGSFTPEREKRIRKVVKIPDNEMFAAVIALSKIPIDEKVKVAKSCKRKVEQIIEVISKST